MALVPPNRAPSGYPLGLTGATAATRYAGATSSGAPASGTFAVGDFVIDQTGKVYVCTAAGSPGTWAQAGGTAVNKNYLAPGLGYESFSRADGITDRSVLVSGRLNMYAIQLPAGITITSITFVAGATAANAPTHQIFGLFDDNAGTASGTARALLRGTTDDTSAAWAANTAKTLALTSTYTTVSTQLYYVGILVTWTTTGPSLYGYPDAMGASFPAIAPIFVGTSNTGITALPNPAAAIAQTTDFLIYFYLS